MPKKYRVRIKAKEPCYLADTDGDPGRTLVVENAKVFGSLKEASGAIVAAMRTHTTQSRTYSIEPCEVSKTKLNKLAQKRFKAIITDLWGREIYPSARQINIARNRHKDSGLSGRECQWRREAFQALGIKLKSGPYGERSDNEIGGYNYVP